MSCEKKCVTGKSRHFREHCTPIFQIVNFRGYVGCVSPLNFTFPYPPVVGEYYFNKKCVDLWQFITVNLVNTWVLVPLTTPYGFFNISTNTVIIVKSAKDYYYYTPLEGDTLLRCGNDGIHNAFYTFLCGQWIVMCETFPIP